MWILGLKALKRAFAQLHTLSRLFHVVQFVKCWQIFVQWNSKVQEKKKESLVITSSTKRAIRQFHVVVGQGRRRSLRKSKCKVVTLPIQTYRFLLSFFCRSHYRRRCRCLTSLFVLFQDAVFVTGRSRLVLVSLKDGSLLASHSIPCEPLSPVAHGDFTNDGLMDFVVHCRGR